MRFADSVRPASGAEHMLSHFWEIKKLERGEISDFHGKKVGVATMIVNRLYHAIAALETVEPKQEELDWESIFAACGENFRDELRSVNFPAVTSETSEDRIRENWPEIRRIIAEELPDDATLTRLMKQAGAATETAAVGVDPALAVCGLKFHPYLRHRMTLSRLIPMLAIAVDYQKYIA